MSQGLPGRQRLWVVHLHLYAEMMLGSGAPGDAKFYSVERAKVIQILQQSQSAADCRSGNFMSNATLAKPVSNPNCGWCSGQQISTRPVNQDRLPAAI